MTFNIFIGLLLVISLLTGLFTQGIKIWLTEKGKTYQPNALAGYVAIALSILVGAAYMIITNARINAQFAVYMIALVLLSWLCAMVGYDKVIQTITQFIAKKAE